MKYTIIGLLMLMGCGTDGQNGLPGTQGPAGTPGSNAYTSINAYTIGANTTCVPITGGSSKRTSSSAKKVYIYTTAGCTGTKVTLKAGEVYYNANAFYTFDNTKLAIYKF